MVSDKFLFDNNNIEKVLDKVEKLALCYDFKSKEVMQIRLLAEEIISVITPTLELSNGRCWVSTDDNAFSISIDCDAGVSGLNEKTKKLLLKMSRQDGNKGVFGMIGKVFEFLTMPEVDYTSLAGHRVFYTHMDSGFSSYSWNPDFVSVLPTTSIQVEKDKKQNNEEANLEISIIEGYADDIRVCLQKSRAGGRLEITVVKNFHSGQISLIEVCN